MTRAADRQVTGLVVMCCATDDAGPLQETVTTLRGEGSDVQLVGGLEKDASQLTDVIGGLRGEGLYVLCRSPRLGREHVEKLREILLSHHVPFARTLTVAVGGRGALADRIRSGLRRASARGGNPAPAPSLAAQPEPVTNVMEDDEPTIVGQNPMGEPAPVLQDPPDAEDEAPEIEHADAHADAPAPPASSIPTAIATDSPAEDDPIEQVDTLSNPRLSLSDLDLSDLDDSIPGARLPPPEDRTMVGRPPALITGNTVIGPAPAMITGDTLTGEKLPEKLRQAAARHVAPWPPKPASAPASAAAPGPIEPATTPFPRLSAEDLKPELPPPRPPEPAVAVPEPTPDAPSASFPAAGSAPGSFPDAPGSAVPTGAGPTSTPTSTAGPGAEPGPNRLPLILGGAAALLLVIIVTVVAWPSDDEDSEVASSTPATDATKDDEGSESEAETPEDEGADEPTPAAAGTPILDALRSRKVRALDVLLVATEASGDSDHATAAAYCESLELEGITGWRLPHVGELNAMSEARMLPRGFYWSATAADLFGDSYLAWNERRETAAAHDKDAVALCVRPVSGGGS